MDEFQRQKITLVVVLLIVLAFFGACAYTATHYPKFALIASSILFLGLGLLCTRFGRDGVIFGVIIIVGAICLFMMGLSL